MDNIAILGLLFISLKKKQKKSLCQKREWKHELKNFP